MWLQIFFNILETSTRPRSAETERKKEDATYRHDKKSDELKAFVVAVREGHEGSVAYWLGCPIVVEAQADRTLRVTKSGSQQ